MKKIIQTNTKVETNSFSFTLQDRNGGLSSWTVWGNCTKPCGSGTSTRTRACDNPTKEGFGADCVGERSQSKPCNTQTCPTTTTQAPTTTTTQPPTTPTTRPTVITGNYGITVLIQLNIDSVSVNHTFLT